MPTLSERRGFLKVLFPSLLAVCLAVSSLPATAAEPPVKPLRALLVLGGCCHDYQAQQKILADGISARAHVEVVVAYDPDKTTRHLNPVYERSDWADGYDVIIHDECTADVKELAIIDRILEPHRQGLPGVVLHCGMHSYRSEGFPDLTPWFEFTGLQTTGHGPQLPIQLTFTNPQDPITAGMKGWKTINEELYNNTTGRLLETATPLASGHQVVTSKEGKQTDANSIVVWTNLYREKTRVFATTLGHNNQTVEDPRYLDLITRGLLWSCRHLEDGYLKNTNAGK